MGDQATTAAPAADGFVPIDTFPSVALDFTQTVNLDTSGGGAGRRVLRVLAFQPTAELVTPPAGYSLQRCQTDETALGVRSHD